jgi:NAD(P)-dependent dehydrogenase (short-subunit alcohol dehydrogenase family)
VPDDRRVALVTGADRGIGFAIVRRLQRDGFALGFATLDRDETAEAAHERLGDGPVEWVTGDLRDPSVPAARRARQQRGVDHGEAGSGADGR